jgi:uncharacterized RDD family membrane protein YckC
MSEAERYLHEVLRHVPAAFPERRARIAADLRSHLSESIAAGESEEGAVRRMGPAEQTAGTFLQGAPLPLAPLADRLGAYVLDNALLAAPVLAAFALAGMRDPAWLASLEQPNTAGARIVVAAVIVATVAVSLLYFPVLEARSGQTPGKRLFGIAVVKASGTAVRFGTAMLRRLPSLFNFALLDAVFAPFTAKRQRAFDIVAGTLVVTSAPSASRARAWIATAVLAALTAVAIVALVSVAPRGAPPAASVRL